MDSLSVSALATTRCFDPLAGGTADAADVGSTCKEADGTNAEIAVEVTGETDAPETPGEAVPGEDIVGAAAGETVSAGARA
jgi:VCBS repeat-containing protein